MWLVGGHSVNSGVALKARETSKIEGKIQFPVRFPALVVVRERRRRAARETAARFLMYWLVQNGRVVSLVQV